MGKRTLRGDLINGYKCLKGGAKKMEPDYLQVVTRDRTKANGHKVKHRKYSMNIRRHFCTGQIMTQLAHGVCSISIPEDIQELPGHSYGQVDLGGSA